MRQPPLIERRRTSTALAVYAGASIVVGFAALAWATVSCPLVPTIGNARLPQLAGDPSVSGLLFWIARNEGGMQMRIAADRTKLLDLRAPREAPREAPGDLRRARRETRGEVG